MPYSHLPEDELNFIIQKFHLTQETYFHNILICVLSSNSHALAVAQWGRTRWKERVQTFRSSRPYTEQGEQSTHCHANAINLKGRLFSAKECKLWAQTRSKGSKNKRIIMKSFSTATPHHHIQHAAAYNKDMEKG